MRMDWFAGNGLGKLTAAANTAIRRLLPPAPNGRTRLTKIVYTNGVTAHLLTVCRALGRTSFTADGAAGQAVVSLLVQPGVTGNLLAANDLVAIREIDGVTRLYIVQAVPSTYPGNVTLTTTLTAGVSQSASTFWNFGILTDVDPITGVAHPTFDLAASVTTTYLEDTNGVVASHVPDSPLLLSVDNITNAGTVAQTGWGYTRDVWPLS